MATLPDGITLRERIRSIAAQVASARDLLMKLPPNRVTGGGSELATLATRAELLSLEILALGDPPRPKRQAEQTAAIMPE